MMGLGRAETDNMSLWEYEARLWHWNDAHGGDDVQPPDPELTQRLINQINREPRIPA